MKVTIQSKPHSQMRYDTLGDWYYEDHGDLIIDVAENAPHPELIALHELVEAWLCDSRGITQAQVDEWDFGIDEGRQVSFSEEPGDNINAPYRKEHRFAMLIEHLMAHELGIQGYGRVE